MDDILPWQVPKKTIAGTAFVVIPRSYFDAAGMISANHCHHMAVPCAFVLALVLQIWLVLSAVFRLEVCVCLCMLQH